MKTAASRSTFRFLYRYLMVLVLVGPVYGADIYFAQAAAGSANGSSCANAESVATFNAGAQTAGNVYHLCGTITSQVVANADGAAGNPITLKFESGAGIIMPALPTDGAVKLWHNYWVVDGGTPCGNVSPGVKTSCSTNLSGTGVIQSTDNGSVGHYGNNVGSHGIDMGTGTTHDIEIKNLLFLDLYHNVIQNDETTAAHNAFWIYGRPGNNYLIHDSTFTWSYGLELALGTGNNTQVYNSVFDHFNHAIEVAEGFTNQIYTNEYVYNNDVHMNSDWFDPASAGGPNTYHNDGIFIYGQGATGYVDGVYVYNNYAHGISGNIGSTNYTCATGYFYLNQNLNNMWVFNNIFKMEGAYACNGTVALGYGTTSQHILNNTFVGYGAAACFSQTANACVAIGDAGPEASASTDIRNNISNQMNSGIAMLDGSLAMFSSAGADYNLYNGWDTHVAGPWHIGTQEFDTFAAWQANTCGSGGCDAHGISNQDPLLSASFVPSSSSPARASAVNLTSVCSGQPIPGLGALCSDANGTVRPSSGNWDMGAIQSGGVSLSPSPLTFSNQAVGTTSASQTLTMTNGQNVSLTGISFSVIGANLGDFSCSAGTLGSTLAAGASGTVICTFAPTATGSRTASIQFVDSASTSPQLVSMSGTGVTNAPITSYSPTSLSFGNQNLNTTSASKSIALTNTGSAPLTVTSIGTNTGTNFAVSSTTPSCGAGCTVAVNGTVIINVTFTPTGTGALTDSVKVVSNAASSPDLVSVSGTGVDPTAINLINTSNCNGASPLTCAITSTTAGDLLAMGCSSNGNQHPNPVLSTVTDNKSNSWAVVAGSRSDDPTDSSTELWYVANVAAGTTSLTITGNGAISVGCFVWEFSNVNTLDQVSQLSSQPSSTTASISATTATAKEALVAVVNPNSRATSLTAGACPFASDNLTFFGDAWAHCISSSTGAKTASWAIPSVTWNASLATFKDVAGGSPVVSLSVSSLSFSGLQTIQTSSPTLTVTLSNNGTGSLTITSIAPAGGNSADFTITSNTCGATLAINASCNVVAQFKPGAAGARSSTLVFTTNASTSPDNVSLSGTAIVQPTSFGGVAARPGVH